MPFGASRAGLMSVRRDAIPDSALLHFPFGERSDSTLVEELEGADGTAVGLTNISGDFRGGFAEDGDGTDDYGDLGDWSVVDFGADLDTTWTVLFTFKTTDDEVYLFGARDDVEGGATGFQVGLGRGTGGVGSGELEFFISDTNDDRLVISTDSAFNDGNKHRGAFVKRGNSASDLEIWIDGSEVSTTTHDDTGLTTTHNFSGLVASHARGRGDGSVNSPADSVIDNPIPCGSDLTSSEIQDDHERQPWS